MRCDCVSFALRHMDVRRDCVSFARPLFRMNGVPYAQEYSIFKFAQNSPHSPGKRVKFFNADKVAGARLPM